MTTGLKTAVVTLTTVIIAACLACAAIAITGGFAIQWAMPIFALAFASLFFVFTGALITELQTLRELTAQRRQLLEKVQDLHEA